MLSQQSLSTPLSRRLERSTHPPAVAPCHLKLPEAAAVPREVFCATTTFVAAFSANGPLLEAPLVDISTDGPLRGTCHTHYLRFNMPDPTGFRFLLDAHFAATPHASFTWGSVTVVGSTCRTRYFRCRCMTELHYISLTPSVSRHVRSPAQPSPQSSSSSPPCPLSP